MQIVSRAAARGGHAIGIVARMVIFSCMVVGRKGRHVIGFLCKGQDGEALEQSHAIMHDLARHMSGVGTKLSVARNDAAKLATLSPRSASALQPKSSHVFILSLLV